MAPPEIQLRYVLRGVIIRMIRLPTRPTLELSTVSVLIVRESTMVAPLRRITRTRRINEQTTYLKPILTVGREIILFGIDKHDAKTQ